MLRDVPDVLALDDRLRSCERRREDFLAALNLSSKYHLDDRFPGLSEYLLSQAEIAGNERLSALNGLFGDRTEAGHSAAAISLELAAQLLGVSVKTVYRLERNPRRMREIGYPGRNVALRFFTDWATPLRTARMLRKAARERCR